MSFRHRIRLRCCRLRRPMAKGTGGVLLTIIAQRATVFRLRVRLIPSSVTKGRQNSTAQIHSEDGKFCSVSPPVPLWQNPGERYMRLKVSYSVGLQLLGLRHAPEYPFCCAVELPEARNDDGRFRECNDPVRMGIANSPAQILFDLWYPAFLHSALKSGRSCNHFALCRFRR